MSLFFKVYWHANQVFRSLKDGWGICMRRISKANSTKIIPVKKPPIFNLYLTQSVDGETSSPVRHWKMAAEGKWGIRQ